MKNTLALSLVVMTAIHSTLLLTSHASFDQFLTYRGRVTDSNRRPLSGVYLMEFQLTDSSRRDSVVWKETQYVRARRGIYQARLGTHRPLPPEYPAYRVWAFAPEGTGWIVEGLPFVVQVGSFQSLPRAERLLRRIQGDVSQAFLSEHQSPQGPFYRVRVGPFDDRFQAESMVLLLRSLGYPAQLLLER